MGMTIEPALGERLPGEAADVFFGSIRFLP